MSKVLDYFILPFNDNIKQSKPSLKSATLFNPSIAFWQEDLFICTFRLFMRYPNINYDVVFPDPFFNPNHPWLGGNNAKTWWNTDTGRGAKENGYDLTAFGIFKLKKKKFILTKFLGTIQGVDTRIMTNKYLKDSFILTSNLFTYDPTITIKNKKKCDVDGCFVIQANLLEIKGKKIKELTTNINLCLEISERIEKNWSIWQYNKIGFRLSYGLVPFHKIYNLAKTLKGDLICKKIDEQVSNPFLEELEDYYTYKKEQFLFISSSTPAVKIKNDTYLAVGHMKYKYEEINNVFPGTTLALFNLEIQNLKKHPAYVYLLFFYTFNPDNGDIISLGPALLPTPTEWGLAFPSGLELYKDKIIVAYGDHDSECKLLIMNKDIIPDTIPMSAKYYKFLLLKQPTTMEID